MAAKKNGCKKGRKAQTERGESLAMEALGRAVGRQTAMNYPAIFEGFEATGISGDDIHPRENVFTFNAWRALGRSVAKGAHGVRVLTWIERKQTNKETGEITIGRMPRTTTVFHVSQTVALDAPIEGVDATAAQEVAA